MKKLRQSSAGFAALLALVLAACPQTSRPPAPRTPAAGGPAPTTPLFRFAAYGDTRDNHDIHREIVKEVTGFQPALVLQTGDLVHHGDAADEWRIFDQIIGDMRRQIPYYPARGNHDVGTSGFYEQRVTSPVASGNRLYYSFEKENLHFVAIDTQQAVGPKSEQGRWLEADLAQARAAGRFIVPFFHKAIFSIGPHAVESDVMALRPVLHALFRRHGVRLAFEGHDHIYYRTVRGRRPALRRPAPRAGSPRRRLREGEPLLHRRRLPGPRSGDGLPARPLQARPVHGALLTLRSSPCGTPSCRDGR